MFRKSHLHLHISKGGFDANPLHPRRGKLNAVWILDLLGAEMTSFVYDFKAIHEAMKGELKAQTEPKPKCHHCDNSGLRWSEILRKYVDCHECDNDEDQL